MNILIVNHYAGSAKHGMVYRYYYLAKYWGEMGHKVRIVASSESHLRKVHPVVDKNVAFEVVDGIEYAWVKTPKYESNNVKRVINMFSFVSALFTRKKEILQNFKPDVIIGSCSYNFEVYPIKSYAKEHNATLIYDIRDLWPLTLYELGGYSKFNPFTFLVQKAEDAYCRKADKVVSVLSNSKEYLMSRGMDEEKFNFIPNGIYLPGWKDNEPLTEEELLPVKRMKERFGTIVAYTGLHGVANSLRYLVDAARILKEQDVGFIFIGDGLEKKKLQRRASDNDLENITFLGYVNKEKIPAYLSQMDILFIGLNKQPLFHYGVSPNKLFDYMMSAKPVVYSIDSANDLVSESGCGIPCEAENSEAIAEAILELKAMTKETREEMGNKGNDFVIENYSYKVLAERYIEAISS